MELNLVRTWPTFSILNFQVKYLAIGPLESVQIWVAFWQPGIKPSAIGRFNLTHVATKDTAMMLGHGY
jgi:hypothetical protein